MQDLGEKLERDLVGQWDSKKSLPDRIYFTKVLRRNLWLMLAGGCVTGFVAASIPFFVKDTYKSTVYAVYENADFGNASSPTVTQGQVGMMARLFKARFESQDFLGEVAENLGGSKVLLAQDPFHKLFFQAISSTPQEEKVQMTRLLAQELEVLPEPDTGLLGLTARSSSPEMAEKLANEAMELFVRKELDEQIKGLDSRLSFLKKNVGPEARASAARSPSAVRSSAEKAERLVNEDREKEYDERLRNLNSQVDSIRRERDQALTSLKRELVKLQTSFQPNHPSVLEKKKEIDLVAGQYRNSEAKVLAEANNARGQLRTVRDQQSKILDSVAIDSAIVPEYKGVFYANLSDRIKEIELEKKSLMEQRENSSLRSRIRILFPANYEPIPFKSLSRSLAYVSVVLGTLITLLLVVLREMRNPLARDGWRIERITGKKIVAQISHKNTHEFTDITPALADKMRTHLSRIQKVDEAARTLLSYRRLELAIMQECRGDVVLLINAGSFDNSAQVIKNFLNIYATDHQDDYLLVDCNLQEPVQTQKDNQKSMVEFWEGSAQFEDVCIEREQMKDAAFDVIPPMAKLSGEKTRIFRAENIGPAIDRIPFKYRKIFIRGMPATHFIENRALLSVATDVFILVDAKRSHYFDLHKTLTHLESDKIRGLVAIGT